MGADADGLFRREPGQGEIVQVNKAVKEMPGRIDLYRQPPLSEVHLNRMRSLSQAPSYLAFMLVQQILDEVLARIVGNPLAGVHQTQGRWRYHGLLDRYACVAHGDIKVAVCVPFVTEGAASEPRQPARMTVSERNLETGRGGVGKAMHTVRAEIVILPLLAVGNDRRPCGFKPLNGISNRVVIESIKARILTVAFSASLHHSTGPWDTSH